ncbi:MFS transporter [Streptomyces sp. NPDC049879]|uniref:MFS transporter n=1 Tax=Streptomyces sp. NPDC049879 TaxID=3365598 RepID=UPI0037A49A17
MTATETRRGPLRTAPLIALSLGYFLVMLDVTVVNVAVPDIRRSLAADASALQWIVDGYSTVFAGLLLLGGSLGDRLGHRKVFLAGLAVFAGSSALCALAPSTAALVAGRLLQGAGAALLVPASLALLQRTYPDRAVRARAIAVWGAVASIAFGAGPAVGGLLVSGLGWRAVFWLNVPVGLLAVVLTTRHIGAGTGAAPSHRTDHVGQILGIIGLVSGATALNEAGTRGWTSPLVLGALAVSAAALTAFARVELSLERSAADGGARAPLMPPSLFRARAFSATALIGMLISLGYYGMLFLATLYFQQERGWSTLATGFALLPSACMGLIAAPLFSRIAARTGPYAPMTGGLLLGAAGFLGWLLASSDTPYPVLLAALAATGLGQTTTALAATAAIIESAPTEGAGIAAAVFNVARQLGSAFGVALFGTFTTTSRNFTTGLHISTILAATAFFTGALLAASTSRHTHPHTP